MIDKKILLVRRHEKLRQLQESRKVVKRLEKELEEINRIVKGI